MLDKCILFLSVLAHARIICFSIYGVQHRRWKMIMNNRTHLVAVQILFIIKVISQYQYSWNFLCFFLSLVQLIKITMDSQVIITASCFHCIVAKGFKVKWVWIVTRKSLIKKLLYINVTTVQNHLYIRIT